MLLDAATICTGKSMSKDNQTFKLYQEVHRRTIAENRAFDRVFSQLPLEQQRLLDACLGELLYATIQATRSITGRKNHGRKEEGREGHAGHATDHRTTGDAPA